MSPDQLREAFEAQATRVEFGPDPLGGIRAEIRRRSRRRSMVRLVSVGGALTATVAAVALGVVSCQPSLPPPVPPIATTVPTSPSPAPSTPDAFAVTVPVYFVGHQAGRSVLYREFRSAVVAADTLDARIAAAARLALSGPPLDPDYASGWRAGAAVRAVTVDNGVSTVDIIGGGTPDAVAMQQLIWTVTAVAADRGTTLSGVRLSVDGVPGPVLNRADASTIQAPLWLISPQQGAVVPATFTLQIDGSVFEAAARVRVRDAGGRVISDQPVLLSVGAPQRGQAAVTLSLPPGRYTVEAYSVSVKDGTEQNLDGHEITVG
jgi:hypothetical protein